MKFAPTRIDGVFTIDLDRHVDERGFFARSYCQDEFAKAGIAFTSTQINLSRNRLRHTLRGMHYQTAPDSEAKIVRAVRGRVYDVVVDVRPDSQTFRQWTAIELDADRANGVFIPEGCAHGFLTLQDDCDVLYQMGRPYVAGKASGFRYDDPAFAISWPAEPLIISEADLTWPAWA